MIVRIVTVLAVVAIVALGTYAALVAGEDTATRVESPTDSNPREIEIQTVRLENGDSIVCVLYSSWNGRYGGISCDFDG